MGTTRLTNSSGGRQGGAPTHPAEFGLLYLVMFWFVPLGLGVVALESAVVMARRARPAVIAVGVPLLVIAGAMLILGGLGSLVMRDHRSTGGILRTG